MTFLKTKKVQEIPIYNLSQDWHITLSKTPLTLPNFLYLIDTTWVGVGVGHTYFENPMSGRTRNT